MPQATHTLFTEGKWKLVVEYFMTKDYKDIELILYGTDRSGRKKWYNLKNRTPIDYIPKYIEDKIRKSMENFEEINLYNKLKMEEG